VLRELSTRLDASGLIASISTGQATDNYRVRLARSLSVRGNGKPVRELSRRCHGPGNRVIESDAEVREPLLEAAELWLVSMPGTDGRLIQRLTHLHRTGRRDRSGVCMKVFERVLVWQSEIAEQPRDLLVEVSHEVFVPEVMNRARE
jgi:hypothetical protein